MPCGRLLTSPPACRRIVIPAAVVYNTGISDNKKETGKQHGRKKCGFLPTAPAPAIRGRAAGERSCNIKGQEKELSGGEPMTTNNRMELLAAIEGLECPEAAPAALR